MRSLVGLVLTLFLASSCTSTNWPFPEVEPGESPEEVLARRTRLPKSLYAELTMSIDSPDRSGVFESVVQFVPARGLRMSAFKDVIVSTRPIFDLVIEDDSFHLAFWGEDDRVEIRSGGSAEAMELDPAFAAIYALGPGLFLPGRNVGAAARSVERSEDRRTILLGGRWVLDAETFGVRRAVIRSRGHSKVEVDYTSYRRVGERFFPERIRISAEEGGLVIEGTLDDLELDVDPDELDFEPLEEEELGELEGAES